MPHFPELTMPCPRTLSSVDALYRHGELFVKFVDVQSFAWPTANKAMFFPFELAAPETVTKVWLRNGATASGNFDIGIYHANGKRIVSTGSTAQSGTSTLQVVDITDTMLDRGAFYMALAMDGTTGTVWAANIAAIDGRAGGLLEQTSAFALPDPATFALYASTRLPLFGLIFDPLTVV